MRTRAEGDRREEKELHDRGWAAVYWAWSWAWALILSQRGRRFYVVSWEETKLPFTVKVCWPSRSCTHYVLLLLTLTIGHCPRNPYVPDDVNLLLLILFAVGTPLVWHCLHHTSRTYVVLFPITLLCWECRGKCCDYYAWFCVLS